MTVTIRQRKYKRRTTNAQRDEYGIKARIADRRKRVLALRAQGYSYRGIAEQLGIDSALAWRDCNQALEQLADEDSIEAVKAELLEVHRLATGALVEDIQQQRAQGQVETIVQPDGSTITKTKSWLNPATLAELGRTCQRIAALLGIGNSTDPEGAAQIGSQTSITLISPGSAAEFGQRAQQLAEARQAEPQSITVEAVEAGTAGSTETGDPDPAPGRAPAPAGPESDQAEPDPDAALARIALEAAARAQQARQGNGSTRRSRRAQEGTQRPAVVFLDPPRRN
jgi:hypothetical protein